MNTPTDPMLAEWMDCLDPSLREAARGYLRNLMDSVPADNSLADTEHERRFALVRQLSLLPSADAPVPIPVVAMITVFASFVALRSAPPLLGFVILLAGFLTGLWSYSQRANRALANETATAAVLDAALPDALPRVAPNRTETAYCEAVRELLPGRAAGDDYLSGELRRDQMSQLADLLDSGRRLESVRSEIATALTAASPDTLRAEVAGLRERLERAADQGSRAAFAQSLALCEERLGRAESLAGLTDRIEAELELVYQAFRAAQSSIASLRVSPAAAGLDAETGNTYVADIAETIGRQTRAVEEAVQELGIRRGV